MTVLCPVCAERQAPPAGLCRPCMRSYTQTDFGQFSIIEWAAKRARRFEAKRTQAVIRELQEALNRS